VQDTAILIPTLLSAIFVLLYTTERAFLSIYIPVLLLIPQIFVVKVSGLPEFTIGQMAIIPVAIGAFIKCFWRWRFSVMDFLVVGYIIVCTYSEYINLGFSPAQNILANMLTTVYAPYYITKGLLHSAKLSVKFAKRLVFLVFISVLISLYEFRFVTNLFISIPGMFFPFQGGTTWPALYRWGFVRIGGPYAQPIFMGMMVGVAILFNYWLWKSKFWKSNFFVLPRLPLSKGAIITWVLFFGVAATFSRAPFAGLVMGGLLMHVGYSSHRMRGLLTVLILSLFFVIYSYESYSYYSAVNPYMANSEAESNAAYRAQLTREYILVAQKNNEWGWGRNHWPKMTGMKSIDNEYLWLWLEHGIIALGLLLAIMAWVSIRLIHRGMNNPRKYHIDNSFIFALLGAIFSIEISLLTVYMGLQIEPVFFMLVGWAEGYLIRSNQHHTLQDEAEEEGCIPKSVT